MWVAILSVALLSTPAGPSPMEPLPVPDYITITATITHGQLYYDLTGNFDDTLGVMQQAIDDINSTMVMSSTEIANEVGSGLGLGLGWLSAGESILGSLLVGTVFTIILGMILTFLLKIMLTVFSYLWRLLPLT